MATDITLLLAETLEARAGTEIDPLPLVRGAVAQGRRIRRRRRIAAGAALATVACVGVAALVVPTLHRDVAPVSEIPGLGSAGRSLLPPAGGQPGAAARPDQVGTDPRIVHFSVDALAGVATTMSWTVSAGSEFVVMTGPRLEARVSVARTAGELEPSLEFMALEGEMNEPAPVRIGARTGSLSGSILPRSDGRSLWAARWQPATGFWAKVEVWATMPGTAAQVAALVRFDSAQVCAMPFRLGDLPSSFTVRGCVIDLSTIGGARLSRGSLRIGDARHELDVQASDASGVADFKGTLTAGSRRVRTVGDGWQMLARPYLIDATSATAESPVGQSVVLQILAGLTTSGTPDDLSSW